MHLNGYSTSHCCQLSDELLVQLLLLFFAARALHICSADAGFVVTA